MQPKSGKPLRLFVNPFAIWTNFALKSGEAVLASTQAAVARANAIKVAVLPDAGAPRPKAARAKTPKAKPKKARKNASSRARRRAP